MYRPSLSVLGGKMWPWQKKRVPDGGLQLAQMLGFPDVATMENAVVLAKAFDLIPQEARGFYEHCVLTHGESAVREFARLVKSGQILTAYPGKSAGEVLKLVSLSVS